MKRLLCLGMIGATAICGCRSISGHQVIQGPDGNPKLVDVRGLPIYVQRPTHAVFVVTRTQSTDGSVSMIVSDKPFMIGPSELYTIDLKRPFAGTINYTMELDGFYPSKISADIDDQTLAQTRELITSVLDKMTGVPTTEGLAASATMESSLVIIELATGAVSVQAL